MKTWNTTTAAKRTMKKKKKKKKTVAKMNKTFKSVTESVYCASAVEAISQAVCATTTRTTIPANVCCRHQRTRKRSATPSLYRTTTK